MTGTGQGKRVGVVGAGTMGSGIAQVFAAANYRVDLVDIDDERIDDAIGRIRASLRKLASRGVIDPAQVDPVLDRIEAVEDCRNIRPATLVIEAAPEISNVKQEIFRRLDEAMPPETILATNTSSISITDIAAATDRPDRVIGMHFMNPVPAMRLVELIRGAATSDGTYRFAEAMVGELGKTAVEVQDYPGFVANRILMPMINEAICALVEGVASAEDIDRVMTLGMNHPMGPLALADFIGLDICLAILEVLYESYSDPKYRPCALLRKMVDAGYLGRKSGKGFFNYES